MSEGNEGWCVFKADFLCPFLTSNTCAMPYYIACSAVTATMLQRHCYSYNASATVADCTQHASAVNGAFGSCASKGAFGSCAREFLRRSMHVVLGVGIECSFVCMAKERVCLLQGSVELQCNVYMSVVGA